MTTYQGPNASVRQLFSVSPGAVAIESLPPTIIASAFDVFKKQNIGSHYGIIEQEVAWTDDAGDAVDKVVYNKTIIDERAYDFYPPVIYADSPFGNIDMEVADADLSATGVTIGLDDDYSLPNIEQVAGVSEAIFPYYNKVANIITTTGTATSDVLNEVNATASDFVTDGVAVGDLVINTDDDISAQVVTVSSLTRLICDGDVCPDGNEVFTIVRPIKVLSTDLSTIIVPNGAVVTAQIKPGQTVFMLGTSDAASATWAEIGTVGSVNADETKVSLATPVAAAITGSQIIIGAVSSALGTLPDTLFDPNADFITNKVRQGDILYFSSQSVAGSVATPLTASVISIVNKNTLKFNTELLDQTGQIDVDFSKYKNSTVAPGSTINIYSYDIKRLVGFSENYDLKALNAAAGVPIVVVSTTSFTIPNAVGVDTVPALSAGDYFILTTANPAASANERELFPTTITIYKISTISYDGSDYTITVDSALYISNDGTTAATTGVFIHAWTPKIETDILGDFRAVRIEETGVATRITSIEDIFTAWVRSEEEEIDPRNELAFMMSIAFQSSGGKVCYGVNVDSTLDLGTVYAAALEELKLVDCYSHALGTTDAGVNGTMAAYCNDQAAPYEGHERIALVCYDDQDVFLQGTDSGSNTVGGLITISGAFNPITAGITINDVVKIYTSAGVFVEQVTVTATPTLTTQVQTDGETLHAAGHEYRFLSGRKSDQAIKIAALGLGERRVAIVWPGWFSASYGDESLTVPPYFITAAIAGMDSGKVASQSFTNYPFSIPGLSNISLNTSTFYRKSDMDEIAGGGINLKIQEASITQSIKSRHDLTTDMSAVQLRERSITKQADVSAKTIRNAVAPYVGRYNITDDLFKFLGQVCSVASTKLVSDGIIKSLDINSIQRDEVIDDKINIFIEATAFIAGNYYDITLLIVTR